MYTLIVENQYGQQLELTHNEAYVVKSVLGMDPPDAVVNTTKYAGQDGSAYNSSYMNQRVITITMAINHPAEQNRIALYGFFRSKFPVKIFYKTETRDVWIEGYVQTFSVAYFDKKETAQITIICPSPYLRSRFPVHDGFDNIEDLFEFPFSLPAAGEVFSNVVHGLFESVINYGDLETGLIITITALGEVISPRIQNLTSGKFFDLLTTMESGDVIIINTNRGEKSVKKIHNGVTTNLIAYRSRGSEWITLLPGDNIFSVSATSGEEYIDVALDFEYLFEGV